MRTALLLVALALVPQTASAADTDARWLPWLGCWQSSAERLVSDDARVCFVPASNGLVERITILDPSTAPPSGQPLNADGVDHPIVDPECRGILILQWSADGHRYFSSSERSCIDEVAARTSGMSLLLPGPAWLEVEAAETSGRETVHVKRYRRVAVPESLAAQLPADLVASADAAADSVSTMRLTVAHIIDASSRMNSNALEAAIIESNTPFLLTTQGLRALSKARVDENVIDLMVAVSYPEHFQVDQPSSASGNVNGGAHGYANGTMWDQMPAMCWYPAFFDPVFCYTSSTFLYSAYHYYETPYYVPPSVIVSPQPPIQPAPGPGPTAGTARAVNNFGYTRVREAEPTPTPNSSTNTNSTRGSAPSAQRTSTRSNSGDSGSTASSGSSSSSSSSSSGSGGGSSGGGGYTSGGGGDTGRTAVPR